MALTSHSRKRLLVGKDLKHDYDDRVQHHNLELLQPIQSANSDSMKCRSPRFIAIRQLQCDG
jgi:hypothetical protein